MTDETGPTKIQQEKIQQKKIQQIEYLTSWKEIATYMHSGVRTVQRYEREMGLPVRRPTGKARGAVMATCAEIDGWIAARPIHKTFELTRTSVDLGQVYTAKMERGMDAMLKLRNQMLELRKETRSAMELLIQKVSSMHRNMPSSRPQGYEPLIGIDWSFDIEEEDQDQNRPDLRKNTALLRPENRQNKRLH
jgi:hypothetical protein